MSAQTTVIAEAIQSGYSPTALPADPCAIVIFGASGDLARRKLIPALYDLAANASLAPSYAIVGFARTAMSDDAFRNTSGEATRKISEVGPVDDTKWTAFAPSLFYFPGDYKDPEAFRRLGARLAELDRDRGLRGNRLFYVSTPPEVYPLLVEQLGRAGLAKPADERSWVRIIIEKPYGRDLESARQLNQAVLRVFDESQVYRIDHYLGKDTVQNLLVFRFGNGIFEPLWNRRYVNHVQITAAESIGVEGRGAYYQEAGALRDMIQNHLLQVMATVAMEPTATFEPDSVRDERSKLLRSIRLMKPEEVAQNAVAGQYGPARIGGADVPGFLEEPGVDPKSQTETYAAATFFVENWRWAGVPFYIRTGKRLPKRVSEIAIQFNSAPHLVFGSNGSLIVPNLLILRIQPEEGISLKFLSKQPGAGMKLRPVSMDFNYGSSFGERSPTAYETLLLDAILGDATLYTRQDMVEASWRVVEPILAVWKNTTFQFPNYAA